MESIMLLWDAWYHSPSLYARVVIVAPIVMVLVIGILLFIRKR